MREIKFRAKDKYTGKWVYGDLIHNQKVTKKGLEPRVMVGGYEVDEDTISQYTGLKDVNNKEIYEGDIVKWTFFFYIGSEVQKDLVGIIKWYQGGSIFDVIKHDIEEAGFYGISDLNTDTESDCEIIGNIYDNKELLNK